MGILADLLVSAPDDAHLYEQRLRTRDFPPGAYERAEFKGLTGLEFGTLWAVVTGQEWDLDKHSLEELTNSGETWLLKFPDTWVKGLAALTAPQIAKVAAEWAATEELQWEPMEAEEVVVELVRLAGQATKQGKNLYLWGSL